MGRTRSTRSASARRSPRIGDTASGSGGGEGEAASTTADSDHKTTSRRTRSARRGKTSKPAEVVRTRTRKTRPPKKKTESSKKETDDDESRDTNESDSEPDDQKEAENKTQNEDGSGNDASEEQEGSHKSDADDEKGGNDEADEEVTAITRTTRSTAKQRRSRRLVNSKAKESSEQEDSDEVNGDQEDVGDDDEEDDEDDVDSQTGTGQKLHPRKDASSDVEEHLTESKSTMEEGANEEKTVDGKEAEIDVESSDAKNEDDVSQEQSASQQGDVDQPDTDNQDFRPAVTVEADHDGSTTSKQEQVETNKKQPVSSKRASDSVKGGDTSKPTTSEDQETDEKSVPEEARLVPQNTSAVKEASPSEDTTALEESQSGSQTEDKSAPEEAMSVHKNTSALKEASSSSEDASALEESQSGALTEDKSAPEEATSVHKNTSALKEASSSSEDASALEESQSGSQTEDKSAPEEAMSVHKNTSALKETSSSSEDASALEESQSGALTEDKPAPEEALSVHKNASALKEASSSSEDASALEESQSGSQTEDKPAPEEAMSVLQNTSALKEASSSSEDTSALEDTKSGPQSSSSAGENFDAEKAKVESQSDAISEDAKSAPQERENRQSMVGTQETVAEEESKLALHQGVESEKDVLPIGDASVAEEGKTQEGDESVVIESTLASAGARPSDGSKLVLPFSDSTEKTKLAPLDDEEEEEDKSKMAPNEQEAIEKSTMTPQEGKTSEEAKLVPQATDSVKVPKAVRYDADTVNDSEVMPQATEATSATEVVEESMVVSRVTVTVDASKIVPQDAEEPNGKLRNPDTIEEANLPSQATASTEEPNTELLQTQGGQSKSMKEVTAAEAESEVQPQEESLQQSVLAEQETPTSEGPPQEASVAVKALLGLQEMPGPDESTSEHQEESDFVSTTNASQDAPQQTSSEKIQELTPGAAVNPESKVAVQEKAETPALDAESTHGTHETSDIGEKIASGSSGGTGAPTPVDPVLDTPKSSDAPPAATTVTVADEGSKIDPSTPMSSAIIVQPVVDRKRGPVSSDSQEEVFFDADAKGHQKSDPGGDVFFDASDEIDEASDEKNSTDGKSDENKGKIITEGSEVNPVHEDPSSTSIAAHSTREEGARVASEVKIVAGELQSTQVVEDTQVSNASTSADSDPESGMVSSATRLESIAVTDTKKEALSTETELTTQSSQTVERGATPQPGSDVQKQNSSHDTGSSRTELDGSSGKKDDVDGDLSQPHLPNANIAAPDRTTPGSGSDDPKGGGVRSKERTQITAQYENRTDLSATKVVPEVAAIDVFEGERDGRTKSQIALAQAGGNELEGGTAGPDRLTSTKHLATDMSRLVGSPEDLESARKVEKEDRLAGEINGGGVKRKTAEEVARVRKRRKLVISIPHDDKSEALPIPRKASIPHPSLERVKMLLFTVGRRVHPHRGYERCFSEYWEALSARLEGQLDSEASIEKSRSVLESFLLTKTLRKLHNTLVMGLVERCLDPRIVTKRIPRSAPSMLVAKAKPVPSANHDSEVDSQTELFSQHVHPLPKDYMPMVLEEHVPKEYAPVQVATTELSIPGAIVVDPVARSLAQGAGMKVSENAIWLLVVAVRAQTTAILKSAIAAKNATEGGKVPPRPTTRPQVLGKRKLNFDSKRDASNSKQTKVELPTKSISAHDIHAITSGIPMGASGSLGGCVSRETFERNLYSSYGFGETFDTSAMADVRKHMASAFTPAPPKNERTGMALKPAVSPPSGLSTSKTSKGGPRVQPSSTHINSDPTKTSTVRPGPTPTPSQPKTDERKGRKSPFSGMGRGAKDLAALKARNSGGTSGNLLAAAAAAATTATTGQSAASTESSKSTIPVHTRLAHPAPATQPSGTTLMPPMVAPQIAVAAYASATASATPIPQSASGRTAQIVPGASSSARQPQSTSSQVVVATEVARTAPSVGGAVPSSERPQSASPIVGVGRPRTGKQSLIALRNAKSKQEVTDVGSTDGASSQMSSSTSSAAIIQQDTPSVPVVKKDTPSKVAVMAALRQQAPLSSIVNSTADAPGFIKTTGETPGQVQHLGATPVTTETQKPGAKPLTSVSTPSDKKPMAPPPTAAPVPELAPAQKPCDPPSTTVAAPGPAANVENVVAVPPAPPSIAPAEASTQGNSSTSAQVPSEEKDSNVQSGSSPRRGKGFGVKNLAAMRARSSGPSSNDGDSGDGGPETDGPGSNDGERSEEPSAPEQSVGPATNGDEPETASQTTHVVTQDQAVPPP